MMEVNRNAIWPHPERVPQDGLERMTGFWGDETWRMAAYAESPQASLFGPEMVKQTNDTIVMAFESRLREIAGFSYVPDPLPMRNSRNAVVDHLFFASGKPVAERVVTDIFDKDR